MWRWRVRDAIAGRNRKDPGGFVTPQQAPDLELIASLSPSLTWIGHASFLLTLGGTRILIDPVFRPRLGPIRRLAPPGVPLEQLPAVDVVIITHNHRDHLDPWTISRLGGRPRYIVPLGNGKVLRSLGVQSIVELDWWQTATHGALEITIVPARHWSMWLPWDRNDALWGGAVIRSPEGTAYHSGDTAYFDTFAEIGRRAGPIDWAMLPIGAYDPRWFMEAQHMCPEEAVQAALALQARHFVAMHWGTFRLTDEPTGEPPERARASWREQGGEDHRLWILDIGESRCLRASVSE